VNDANLLKDEILLSTSSITLSPIPEKVPNELYNRPPKTIKFNYDSINSALPSIFCGWVVLESKRLPVSEMRMAPVGAVKTILKMHTINTISAYGLSGSLASKCFNATGPRAA
jgi:hypothetical protein